MQHEDHQVAPPPKTHNLVASAPIAKNHQPDTLPPPTPTPDKTKSTWRNQSDRPINKSTNKATRAKKGNTQNKRKQKSRQG
jgi:hypothetical protein